MEGLNRGTARNKVRKVVMADDMGPIGHRKALNFILSEKEAHGGLGQRSN